MYAIETRDGPATYYCIHCMAQSGMLLGSQTVQSTVYTETYETCEDCVRERLEQIERYYKRKPKFNVGDLVQIKSKLDWIPEFILTRKLYRINNILANRTLKICYRLSNGDIKLESMLDLP